MTPTDDAAATRLLADYHHAGGYADTIPDMPHRGTLTPALITVLSEWLSELETRWHGPETEGRALARLSIVKALGVKEARKTVAIPALITQFDRAKTMSSYARWSAGQSLYDIPAGKEYFEQMASIARDRSLGEDRQMVVDWLGKSRHPDAAAVALAQLDDESVQGHALDALAKLRAQGVREQVEPFLNSKFPWYRRSAKRIVHYDES